MKQEQVKDFTRRISQCNRGGMIVVVYDIIFAYLEDAKECQKANDYEGFKEGVLKAQNGVTELMQTLDFQYDVAKELYPLYVFVKETMAKAIIRKSIEELAQGEEVLKNLYEAFVEASKQDQSNPLMQNAQQVYAGMTYGKNDLTETYQELETSRGFFA